MTTYNTLLSASGLSLREAAEQEKNYAIMDEIVGLCEFERDPHKAVALALGKKFKEKK